MRHASGILRWTAGLLALALAGGPGGVATASPELQLSPERVEIGAFFQGTKVTVTGEIPEESTAVVEVVGQTATEKLLRKGRRAGLWMTVGEIEVHHAPTLYLVLSSSPEIPTLPRGETPWGLEALRQRVRFRGGISAQEEERFFQEFLKLKQSEELYRLLPGTLTLAGGREGRYTLRGTLPLPAKVPPGRYQVRLALLQHGRLREQRNCHLTVEMVGFPAMLARLAYQHGPLYGIVAVVIAIVTGFLMGLLFKGKGEH